MSQKENSHNVDKLVERLKRSVGAASDSELARMMGIRPTVIANWRTRKSVNYDKIISFCESEGLSLDMLFDNKRSSTDRPRYSPEVKHNIVMIDARASAGYPQQIDNPAFFAKLPSFNIPRPEFQHSSFRCFEVAGDSMEPTLPHGSWVFGRQHHHGEKIADGRIYAIVTPEGFLIKRILDRSQEKGQLALVSDNPSYRTQVVPTSEVLELWYITANLNFDLRNIHKDLRDDLNQAIGDIALIQNELKSIKLQLKP